jgi:RNA polymerase sigma factor (sigma-70 family)
MRHQGDPPEAPGGTIDAEFVREALERHERALVGYARRLLGDLDRARDVVQDTFLRLVRADRAQVEPVLARWLFTVCRNRAFDERRRSARHARPLDGLEGQASRAASPDSLPEAADEAARARVAIDGLPEHVREVLVLRLSCGLAYADIAAVTGLSTSHVGVKVHEGMKTLRARLSVKRPVRAAHGGDVR